MAENETGEEEVTEAEVIDAAIQADRLELHTAIPARVEEFNANDGKPIVKVTLMINRMLPDGDDNYVSEQLPQLADVPVQFPRTKKFRFTFPLEKGDTGAVICCETNIGAWRATGARTDPDDIGRHTLDGAFFVPGLFADTDPMTTDGGSAMLLGRDGADSALVEITDSEIHLGKGATKEVARKGDTCDGGTLYFQGGTGGATLTYSPPGAGAGVGTPLVLAPKINQGSSKVKAGD